MHGAVINANTRKLAHTYETSIICAQCSAPARLKTISRNWCPLEEIVVEIREFVCEGCHSRTFLKIPV